MLSSDTSIVQSIIIFIVVLCILWNQFDVFDNVAYVFNMIIYAPAATYSSVLTFL